MGNHRFQSIQHDAICCWLRRQPKHEPRSTSIQYLWQQDYKPSVQLQDWKKKELFSLTLLIESSTRSLQSLVMTELERKKASIND